MGYWSVQGPVWAEAIASSKSDVGRWFSWGPENCSGVKPCTGAAPKGMPGRNVQVPGVGCAQGSWGSEGADSGFKSALASFGSETYSSYLSDALANSWTRNLGVDGYTIDCSADYTPCMMQTQTAQHDFYRTIVGKVRETQPQVVLSGEDYSSWDEVIRTDSQMAGQGEPTYHAAMQKAVLSADLSNLENIARSSGADTAILACYLHPGLDGQQPGGCPTMYYRDGTATLKNVRQHQMWVALEAASGVVPQHDFDGEHWWNVTNDPHDGTLSPLWAFTKHRALNRLALRTKLPIIGQSNKSGALVYLKHDSMGPRGDAAILIFNPGTYTYNPNYA
eukprot:SAG31_NODE_951_length_10810_cov_3.083652_4_plen_335_part_00